MTKDTLTSSRSHYSNLYDARYVARENQGIKIKPLRVDKDTVESKQEKAQKKLFTRFNIEGKKSKKKAIALMFLRASKFALLSLALPFAYVLIKWPYAVIQKTLKIFKEFSQSMQNFLKKTEFLLKKTEKIVNFALDLIDKALFPLSKIAKYCARKGKEIQNFFYKRGHALYEKIPKLTISIHFKLPKLRLPVNPLEGIFNAANILRNITNRINSAIKVLSDLFKATIKFLKFNPFKSFDIFPKLNRAKNTAVKRIFSNKFLAKAQCISQSMQEYIKKNLLRLSNLYKRLVKKMHSIQEVIKSTLVLPLHFAQQHILIPAISLMKAFVGKKAFSLPKRKNKKTYNFHAIKKTFKKLEYFLEKGFKFLTIVFTKFTALIVFCTHYFLKIVRKFMRFFVMALYGISQVVLFIAALLWLSLQLTYQVILENVLVKNEDLK